MIKEEVLRRFPLFDVLDGPFLSQAALKARPMSAKKGTIVFKRGKSLQEFYFLVDGEINLINNEFDVERVLGGSKRAKFTLNSEEPTTVSAIAKTPVTFFTIPVQTVEALVAASQRAFMQELEPTSEDTGQMEVSEASEGQDWMSCLLQSPILNRVPLPQLQELFKKFENVFVKKGQRIIREGGRGDYFYVLAAGTALVTDCAGSICTELKAGQYFGEEALISDSVRNASVTMTSNGLLKRLSAEDFSELLKNSVLQTIEAEQVQGLSQPFELLDVRMPIEFRAFHQPGSVNVPLSRLRRAMPHLVKEHTYLVADDAGGRANVAVYLLCQAGFNAMLLKSQCRDAQLLRA